MPHGAAVAIGLETALDWNVQGAPAAFAGVAAALGTGVAEVPDEFRQLWGQCGFAGVVAGLPEHDLDAGAIAEAMVAEENLPMYRNSCRLASDRERRELAARTASVWADLRS